MEPKPFGSVYYEYNILLRIDYILPIQMHLKGMKKTFEINMLVNAA